MIETSALPGNAELVLENIQIHPPFPKEGELISITGDVYNAGIVNTESLASIITAAYFIDGDLVFINEIGNVNPGIQNKIKISSGPVWSAQMGNHDVKIILDYYNSLNDKYDSPSDNIIEKTFFIESIQSSSLLIDIVPKYFIQGKIIPIITATLLDSNSMPLSGQNIVLTFNDKAFNLETNREGKISFSNEVESLGLNQINAYFEGDLHHSSINVTSSFYSLPKETTSAIIMKLIDDSDQYTFKEFEFDVVVFQDSYENLIVKSKSSPDTLFDPKTFWITLPPLHEYFAEIYMNGRLLFVTDKELLNKDSIIVNELKIPETGKIKFKILDEQNKPVNGIVKSWIYSTSLQGGNTDWIDVLPTKFTEPYVAEVVLPDNTTFKSEPFFVFSGEKKTIEITVKNKSSKIPDWIKNNAGWWADGSIDDDSFIQGIQFLIKERIIKIPSTTQGDGTGSSKIPDWIKNNAGWWADGSIDDDSFIQGIQFLIKERIIKIS